jgi:CRISPR/Cas system-associated exonuclease Cas4 (RecB family)
MPDVREPTLAAAEDICSADLLAETAQATVRWKKDTPESLDAKGRGLVRAYLAKYGEQPVVAVEERFEVDLVNPDTGECLPRPLLGYFDLLVEDGDSIVEVKTTARAWSASSLDRHLQVGAYAAAAIAMHGEAKVVVHTIIKTKTPRVEELLVERTEESNRWFFQAASAIERAIGASHFPPTPGPLCFECEFAKACLEWRAPEAERPRPERLHQPAVRATTAVPL